MRAEKADFQETPHDAARESVRSYSIKKDVKRKIVQLSQDIYALQIPTETNISLHTRRSIYNNIQVYKVPHLTDA